MAACNNNKAGNAPATTTTAASPGTETTVYVQSDTLLSKYEYAKDMSKRLQDKGKSAQSDVASKEEAFKREVVEYQKNAATMPADKRQATEQRLQREKQEFDQYQQRAGAEFQNEQGTETGKLYDKLTEFAKAYAKEKGYKAILTYSKSNPSVLYVDPSLDITAEVVKKLNDAYAKDKK
ncbi:OmpH family outer membrane protein [Mucilaginibacter sp.]|uniref:OmpH family outer membrane protein n=1 Tax=Mucilaginibacter sp. TaxID=1882438 RepID=UPI002611DA87|nr:OmpH family outer membrane protein [Mucilaginibacter sp.]MDB4926263.1 OmpH family outer membrane protein [Mucilaginibacter sp.]